MMKKYQAQFVLFCFLSPLFLVAQQFPVVPSVIVPRPLPTATVDLLGRTGDPVLILTNTSLQSRQIMIGATITGDNGINGTVDPRLKRPQRPIMLPGGRTATLSGDDLLSIFANYDVFDIKLRGIDLRSLIQNQLFPEGTYRVCVQVYDFSTGVPLSAPGSGCTGGLTVRTPDPPIIIQPREHETLLASEWQNLTFRWTPAQLRSTLPRYNCRIVEVPNGVNPYDAMDNDNLVRWEERDLFKTSFIYDVSFPTLPQGRYAVQVTAYDPEGEIAIKNQGKSDIVQFTISEELPGPPRLIAPTDRAEIPQQTPQAYRFSWRAPDGVQAPPRYRFQLVDIPSASSARALIDAPGALIYSTDNIRSTVLIFKELDPVLKVGNMYAWRVQAYDPEEQLVFQNEGYSEVYTFTVKERLLPAPEIVTPEEEAIITANRPFSLEFDWSHEVPASADITYDLDVWENVQGATLSEIVEVKEPLFTESRLAETRFVTSDSRLANGGMFFARVTARSVGESMNFANEGRSTLREFEIKRYSSNLSIDLACGEGCQFTLPEETEAVDYFGLGDTVRLGNFLLRLTDATVRSGTFYRGEAEIVTGNFFKAPVKVALSNLRFNAQGIAIGGLAEAQPPANLALPAAWTGNLGNLRLPPDPAQAIRTLTANSRDVAAASSVAQSLPLAFGGLHLTYLRLLPTTATANLVNLQEFSGDRRTGSKYGLFAKRGVCFSAAGPAVAEEEAFLPLSADVNLDRSASYDLTLLSSAGDAAFGGTAIPFSCTSESPEVHVAGYVAIKTTGLSMAGQPLASTPLYASFRTTYTDWLDWQADLYPRVSSARNSCCNSHGTFELIYSQLPQYRLEVEELILDHSGFSNPAGLTLPEGSNGPNQDLLAQFPDFVNIWSGIYLKKGNWSLPGFVRKTNGEKFELSAQGFVLDDLGLSGQLEVATDEYAPAGNIQDWAAKFGGGQIDVQEGQLVESSLELEVRLPLFESFFAVRGESSWDGRRASWLFTLPNLQQTERRIPAWSADVTLSNYYSRLFGIVNPAGETLLLSTSFGGTLKFDNEIDDIAGIRLDAIDFRGLSVNNWLTANNQRNPVTVGSFITSPHQVYRIGGYQVFIDEVKLRSQPASGPLRLGPSQPASGGQPAGSLLSIDYHFNFDNLASGGLLGIVGEGRFELLAVPEGTPLQRLQRHGTTLAPIPVNWEPMNGLEATGTVSYQATPAGSLFKGDIQLEVLGYDARVVGQLGGINGNSFWAFSADIPFPEPVPVFLGLSAHSFGGGIYYNMVKPVVPANGASATNIVFTPPAAGRNSGNYGIMLSSVLLDQGSSGGAFNGRFLLELDMRRQGLEQVRLSGMAHLVETDLPTDYWLRHTTPDPDAAFTVDGSIRFNWPNKTFEALAGYRLNFEDGLVTGRGDEVVDILVNRRNWHIYLGQRGNPINADLNLLSDPIELDAYFTLEGRTDDWSSAFESLQLGLKGRYYSRSDAYDVPGTVADRIRFAGWASFDLEGGFGTNTTFCLNHPDGEFFAYLSAAAELGFYVQYYESKRSFLPWRVINRKWNKWQCWFGWDMSANISLYTPNPTGINLGVTVDIPVLGNESFNLRLGSRCE